MYVLFKDMPCLWMLFIYVHSRPRCCDLGRHFFNVFLGYLVVKLELYMTIECTVSNNCIT